MKQPFLLVLPWLFLGCADQAPAGRVFTLREIQRFGNEDFQVADSSDLDRHFGAGILADVAGIVADSTGTLFVLDRDWLKIATFGPSGEFLDLVRGGKGEGPGEFSLPVHLTQGGEGRLSVLDYELGRVTWFQEDGTPQVIPLNKGGLLEHLVAGDTIYVTSPHRNPERAPFVTLFSASGDSIGVGPLLPEEDRPFGAPRSMAHGPDGTVLVTTKRPGVWMERRDGRWNRRGNPLFPEALPPREDTVSATEIQVTPAQVSAFGLATTPDGLVIQGYQRYPRPFSWEDPRGTNEVEWFLGLFEAYGQHLGSIRLPNGVYSSCLATSPRSGHVFLCSVDPFPQVIEYEVEMGGNDFE